MEYPRTKYQITITLDREEYTETLWALFSGAVALEARKEAQEDASALALRLKVLKEKLMDAPTKVIAPRMALVETDSI